mmetsp:Transcript_16155/g.32191  ORF Transcript_16155/g.32191 Transcript_16155/m.32191 type:complete len:348 (-) Transcript_16155:31-1074(-)
MRPRLSVILGLATASATEPYFRQALDNAYGQGKTTTAYMGAAVNEGNFNDETYLSVASDYYNLVTSENSCKFGAIQGKQGEFDFSGCDQVLDFAVQNSMAFRGHNLIWGVYNPSWVENGNMTSDELKNVLETHIATVLSHYKGKAVAWDVVNEALNETGTLKHNIWNNITDNYIDVAFKAARKADPDTKLFYNDYNVASSSGWSKTKSDAMYDMVKGMLDRGVPVDGVGLQFHVGTGYDMLDGVKMNMARYGELGVEVHITELDLVCSQKNGYDCTWSSEMEAQQGQLYSNLLDLCLSEPACTNFETWGFTDKYTWQDDGTHPLPFYEDYSAKKAVDDMYQVLQALS